MTVQQIIDEVAARLADPARVAAVTTAADNVDHIPGLGDVRPWHPAALGEGHAGIALLFAELARNDPAHRRTAHAHLAAAAAAVSEMSGVSLYSGITSLAFAAMAAAEQPGDYAALLATLDDHIRAGVAELAGRRPTHTGDYDVVYGLAGVGRYLLGRGEAQRAALVGVLTRLVELAEPVEVDGTRVPGWWVPDPPSPLLAEDPRFAGGHFNLGLAHGIPGPLALLATAWRAGVRVPGQKLAIERMAGWLHDWCQHDPEGPFWPAYVSLGDYTNGTAPHSRARLAWCYGVPGVARAMQLAGQALDRKSWTATAVTAMRAALRREVGTWGVTDSALCHGWAGLMHVTWRIARDAGDAELADGCTRFADWIVDAFQAETPFGFRYRGTHLPTARDRAGFLEGAAGIALALLTFVRGEEPHTGWDRALLLA